MKRTPTQWGTVHVHAADIVPSSNYTVETVVVGSASDLGSATGWLWGDTFPLGGDGVVNNDDVDCVLDGFGGSFFDCSLQADDLMFCTPNGLIDIDDVLGVLEAFGGTPYSQFCPEPCGGAAASGSSPTPSIPAVVSLVVNSSALQSGGLLSVDVYLDNLVDLRGYQVALDVTGGTTGTLSRESVTVDTRHADPQGNGDYVFFGSQSVTATDEIGGRLAAALYNGGVSSGSAKYAGTFTFRASMDASGTFNVGVRMADTLLRDSNIALIEAQATGIVQVSIPIP